MQDSLQQKQSHKPSRSRGFTLVELLIVMIIIGLLAALVGPKLFGHVGTSKAKAARAQIEMLGSALDTFRLDYGRYPTTDEGMKVLWEKPAEDAKDIGNWKGPYLKKKVEKDPWGGDYQYKMPGIHGDYDLIAFGADKKEGGTGEDADINSWE